MMILHSLMILYFHNLLHRVRVEKSFFDQQIQFIFLANNKRIKVSELNLSLVKCDFVVLSSNPRKQNVARIQFYKAYGFTFHF